jgi:hypothetical protein
MKDMKEIDEGRGEEREERREKRVNTHIHKYTNTP